MSEISFKITDQRPQIPLALRAELGDIVPKKKPEPEYSSVISYQTYEAVAGMIEVRSKSMKIARRK